MKNDLSKSALSVPGMPRHLFMGLCFHPDRLRQNNYDLKSKLYLKNQSQFRK